MTAADAAQDLYELVENLRASAEEAYERQAWAGDNQLARSYGELAKTAAATFPSDPVLGNLQVSIPSELDVLIHRDPSSLTAWVRMQLGQLATRLSQLPQRNKRTTSIADLNLLFLRDDSMRQIVANDYTEAQRAYYANAPKAAALLCGAAIEGMLIDVLRQPEIESDPRFGQYLSDKKKKKLYWSRAGLEMLVGLARALGLLRETTARLASSATDFRNTVHPDNERRTSLRAGVAEANILINIVQLIASDLNARAG